MFLANRCEQQRRGPGLPGLPGLPGPESRTPRDRGRSSRSSRSSAVLMRLNEIHLNQGYQDYQSPMRAYGHLWTITWSSIFHYQFPIVFGDWAEIELDTFEELNFAVYGLWHQWITEYHKHPIKSHKHIQSIDVYSAWIIISDHKRRIKFNSIQIPEAFSATWAPGAVEVGVPASNKGRAMAGNKMAVKMAISQISIADGRQFYTFYFNLLHTFSYWKYPGLSWTISIIILASLVSICLHCQSKVSHVSSTRRIHFHTSTSRPPMPPRPLRNAHSEGPGPSGYEEGIEEGPTASSLPWI